MEDAVRQLLAAGTLRDVFSRAHETRLKLEKSGCFRDISVLVDVSRGPEATPEGLEVMLSFMRRNEIVILIRDYQFNRFSHHFAMVRL